MQAGAHAVTAPVGGEPDPVAALIAAGDHRAAREVLAAARAALGAARPEEGA
jgi:hypothetical protein